MVHLYLDEVKHYLKPVIPINRNFLYALEQDLYEYMDSHPNCGYEDFVDYFGTPEFISMQQLESLGEEDIDRIAKKRKKNICIIIFLLCLLLLTIGYIIYISNYAQGTGTLTLEVEDAGYIDDSVLE